MTESKGRDVVVNVSTDGAAFNPVGEMHDVDMQLAGNTLDVTKFSDAFIRKIQGLKDCSWSMQGFYDPTDTDGQKAILDGFMNDTPLYLQFIFVPTAAAGSQGFQQQVVVSKLDVKAAVANTVDADLSFDGSGPVTLV